MYRVRQRVILFSRTTGWNVSISFVNSLPQIAIVNARRTLQTIGFISRQYRHIRVTNDKPFTSRRQRTRLWFPTSFFRLVAFITIFGAHDGVNIGFFAARAQTIAIRHRITGYVRFVRRHVLPTGCTEMIRRFYGTNGLQVIPPNRRLFGNGANAIGVTTFRNKCTETSLWMLILPYLFNATNGPNRSNFSRRISSFVEITGGNHRTTQRNDNFGDSQHRRTKFGVRIDVGGP